MNNVNLVGRLTQDPEVKELQDGTFRTVIYLAISRDYRNSEGGYDADFIKCVLWNAIASATKDYCHKGDIVGVRGKIQTRSYETIEKERKHVMEVIVEKITFIASASQKSLSC